MSEPTCVNLREQFGKQYRIGWEADGATKAQWPKEDWPWLMEIRCRHGKVYPKGGEILQAMTPKRRVGAKLRALPCVLSAKGDLETVITFHVDDAPAVFAVLKPYRRRQLSEAARERLRAVGAAHKFKRQGDEHGSQSDFPALESTQSRSDEPEAG